MFKYFLFFSLINNINALGNYQGLTISKYNNFYDCQINKYYNQTTYSVEYNCSCFQFNSCNETSKLNIDNILSINNISSCIPKNFDYYKCYKCNNYYVSINKDYLNNMCYVYILVIVFFFIAMMTAISTYFYFHKRKTRKNRVVFVKHYNTI